MNFSFQSHMVTEEWNTSHIYNYTGNESLSVHQHETVPRPYYGEYLEVYRRGYASFHGYLSLTVCIFGLTSNVLNIVVLTRKNMMSPTNTILTGLAVADMMVMFSYLPFAIHDYIGKGLEEDERYYGWAAFALFHAHFTVVNHTISTWLTVTVAIWRFMAVCCPAATIRWRGLPHARTAVISTYISCTVFCIPLYMAFTVAEFEKDGRKWYRVDFSQIAQARNSLLSNINFWLFAVISKLVPCAVLTVLSIMLLRVLNQATRRRQRLKMASDCDRAHDRTTKMLLAVLFLFLVTEFPSGMLALLSGALGKDFFVNVYLNFAETMDILALVNSAVNFIIYCSMSRLFRDTFAFLFFPKVKGKWAAIPATEQTQTVGTACV